MANSDIDQNAVIRVLNSILETEMAHVG
jgi:hypothetical protein